VAGALLTLFLAVALFSRFGLDEELRRDEAIYAYGGQRLVEGVPPYVSIIDPKTPLAHVLAGAAVAVGRVGGVDDLVAIRLGFFVIACLAVVAVYLAGIALFGSIRAGLAAAVALLAFKGFAIDALGGPNAKTAAVLFGLLATVLLVRRRWFWGAFAASLGALVWQPYAIYGIVALVAAWLSDGPSGRARRLGAVLAGGAIPVAAVLASFAAAGALADLVEYAVVLPLTGIDRGDTPFAQHVRHLIATVHSAYGPSAWLLWIGLALLVAVTAQRVWAATRRAPLGAEPLVTIVLPPAAFFVAFSLVDFQGYPDAYPLLPYAALGVAGAAAHGFAALDLRRPRATAVVGGGIIAAAAVATFAWYSGPRPEANALVAQRADVAEVARLLGDGGTVHSLGDPTPLVLMGRASPSAGIFLSSGIDRWIVEHTPGGFDGWTDELAAADPDIVLIGGWGGDFNGPMRGWLGQDRELIHIGQLRLFVTPEIRARAAE
jgi:hypothetical protein